MEGLPDRIKRLRHARGWNQHELAKAVGVEQPTVSRWERGISTPEDKFLHRMARIGNMPPSLLKYGASGPHALPTVPVVGYIGAGESVIVMDDHAQGAGFEQVPAPPGIENKDLVAVRIRGDSMRPLRDGWIVYYGRDAEGVPGDCLNRVCVVQLTDGQLLIKELRRGYTEGRFTLHSWSAGVDPIEDAAIVWAAPVAAILPT